MDDWIEDEALRADRRRVWRRVAWVAGIGLVVGAAGGLAIAVGSRGDAGSVELVVGAALTVAGFAGIAAVFTTSMGLASFQTEARRLLDTATRRASVRAVWAGDPATVPIEELPVVRAWAEQYLLATPFSLAQSLLLFTALAGTRVFSIPDTDSWEVVFNTAYFVFIGLVVVITVPWTLRRLRRARTFVLATREVATG